MIKGTDCVRDQLTAQPHICHIVIFKLTYISPIPDTLSYIYTRHIHLLSIFVENSNTIFKSNFIRLINCTIHLSNVRVLQNYNRIFVSTGPRAQNLVLFLCGQRARPASLTARRPDLCRYRMAEGGSDPGISHIGVQCPTHSATRLPDSYVGKTHALVCLKNGEKSSALFGQFQIISEETTKRRMSVVWKSVFPHAQIKCIINQIYSN